MAPAQRAAPQTLSTRPRSAVRLPWPRAILAGGLLLAEYVFVSVFFTVDSLRGRGGWWSGVGLLDPLGAVLLASIAASLLAAAATLRGSRVDLTSLLGAQPALAPAVCAHLTAFALFVATTHYVFGAAFAAASAPGAWLAAWTTLAAAVVISAVAIAFPLGAIATVFARLRRPLAMGVGVGVVAWLAGRTTVELWSVLSRFTFDSTAALLRLAGQRVVARPETFELGIDDYRVTIAASCAGYEGIGVIAVFLGAFLCLERARLRFPRAWMLLPIGVTAAFAANVLRIALLIWLGRWVSPAVAEGSFHSKAGWVLYCAIALGMVAGVRRSALWMRDSPQLTADTWNPTAVYLGPLLAVVATALATGLVSTNFDYLYPLRVLAVAVVLWRSRALLPLRWRSPSWSALALGAVVFVVWLALEPPPDLDRVTAWRAELETMPAALRATWLTFRVLGAVVTVPIAEELAFRGFLLRRLIAPDFTEVSARAFTWPSLLISSIAFGALHQRWIAGTIAGCCYAAAQQRRGRLEDAIAAHALTNGLIAAHVLLAGAWWFWL